MATAGTDSGVETGNESNDLDDISVNVINEMGDPIALEDCQHSSSFESGLNNLFPNPSPCSDEKDVPPPPPPTSPNICGTGSSDDLFQDEDDGGGRHEFSSDSLDGMQGDPTEDCELEEEEEEEEEEDGVGDMEEMTMDRDFNEDRQESSGHGSYTPSPPFLNEFNPVGGGCDSFSKNKIEEFVKFILIYNFFDCCRFKWSIRECVWTSHDGIPAQCLINGSFLGKFKQT
jgi:hypothetical protein